MGFDLEGNKKDKSFRNNVWWWRPLWEYVVDVCEDILDEDDIKSGQYNDGYEITEEKAKKINKRLELALKNGAVKKYEARYKKHSDNLPDEKCNICNGTGVRNDRIVRGVCNGCEGKGKKRPFATNYPFCEDNVKEFSKFCKESGGFKIY